MASRPSPSGRRVVILALVATLVLSLGASVAAAQSVRGAGGTVVVDSGETVDGVEAVAGAVVIRGTVTGDLSGVAGTVHVADGGRIDGDVDVAAGTVRIDGDVAGDVSAGAGTVTVGDAARIGGSLDTGAGYVAIDGWIDGDVQIGAETVAVGSTARIGGDLRYDAVTFDRHPDAVVEGSAVRDASIGEDGGRDVVPGLGAVFGFLADLSLGVVLLLAFPDFSGDVAARVTDAPVRTGGAGLLALLGVPLALVVVAVTVVGIPLVLVGAVAFTIGIWIAVVYGQFAVGTWALGLVGRGGRWLALVVGLVGFALLGAIPILGGLVEFAAVVLGLGALAVGLRDAYRRHGGDDGGRQTTLDEATGEPSTS